MRSVLAGCESALLVVEAVRSSQDPAGVDEDASTSVEVYFVIGAVDVDGRLPRLLDDFAVSAPVHAEGHAIQGVVEALATCSCVERGEVVCRLNNSF